MRARPRDVLLQRHRVGPWVSAGTGQNEVNIHVVPMPPKELELLHFLASHQNEVFTREQLLEDLHGAASSVDRSVDSHIKNLRKKLETASGEPMIETVYGIGYRFTRE